MSGKYLGLRRRLARSPGRSLTIGFDELDTLVVGGLPGSARRFRTWWGNEVEQRHVQAQAWMRAGHRVSAVRLGEAVVFERTTPPLARLDVMSVGIEAVTLAGSVGLHRGVAVPDRGAAWLVEALIAVLPDDEGPRRVGPLDGEAFLVACWYSLRGGAAFGVLVGTDGRHLARAEGVTLVEAFGGVGEAPREDAAPRR